MKTAVSLFSGCGGSDSGILQAGFTVLMANDKLAYAKDVYEANHAETDYRLADVQKIKTFPSADLLVGCYPCQGFSQGGVRDPSRRINTLYLEFARALLQMKPKAFIVLKNGYVADDSLLETLKIHVKEQAGPWKYPRWIDVRTDLPRTATGKIQRFKLRDEDLLSP